jgi:predicted ester cyclase
MSARLFLPVLLAALLALPIRAEEPVSPRVLAANKEVVQRFIEEGLSRGEVKVLDELVAPNFVDASPGSPDVRGPAVVRASQARIREHFTDLRYHVDLLLAEGDRVAARYSVHALRKAEKDGDPKDAGKEVEILGMTIYRLASGRLVESWTINDQLGMLRQLGYSVTPPPSSTPPKAQKRNPAKPPSR